MASLLDLLKKGGNAIKDAFTYTEEERASGKKPSVLERIPMRTAEARDNVQSFFAPDDNPDVRVGEFLREVPGATGDLAKEIAQGTARSLDFVGRKIQDPIGDLLGIDTELDRSRSTKLEDILYGGRDKRVDTLAERGQVELGIDPEKSPILAPVVGFGLTALDLVPGGQGKGKSIKLLERFGDDVIEAFSKSTDPKVIKDVIVKSGDDITEEVATRLADDIASTKSTKKIKETIKQTENALNGKPQIYKTQVEADGWVKRHGDQIKATQDEIARIKADPALNSPKRVRTLQSDLQYLRNAQRGAELDSLAFRTQELMKKAPKTKGVARETGDILTEAKKVPQGKFIEKYTVKGLEEGVTPHTRLDIDVLDSPDFEFNFRELGSFPEEAQQVITERAKNFDPNKFDPIVVSRTKMGWDVEDGNHRLASLILASKNGNKQAQEMLKNVPVVFDDSSLKKIWKASRSNDFLDDAISELRIEFDGKTIDAPTKKPQNIKELMDTKVQLAKDKTINDVPREYQPKVAKALDKAEAETKKLSERRLKDAKKYGISEDVMSRMLYAKAGGRMTHEEASNLAETVRAPMNDLLTKEANTFPLNRPKIEAYSQELEGYFRNVVKDLKAQAEAFPDDSILRQQYEEASRKYMKARTTLEAVISEAGRVVEGSKVIGRYSRLPQMDTKIKQVRDRIVDFANKNPKHANLPTEFDMALETVDVNNATQLLDFLTQWNRASFLQKLSEFQKASLLSALSTHAVNALGNAIQQVLDIPTRALAGGIDAVRSGVTRTPREVYAGESLAQVRGAFRSFPSAMERAWKALKNEHFAQELRRTEIEAGTPVPAIRGRFGKVVRIPFRLLQMADLGFRTVKQGAESEALAVRIAKKEGLKGKAYKDRVKELSSKLPEDMLDFIDERVERSLMLEELDGLLKSVENLKNQYPIMQFVIPFYRTLVNLSREAYRMTPIGGVGRTVGRVIPGQAGRNIERAFSNKWTQNEATRMEELSRQIIGTGIMAWVVTNMLNGDVEITGPAPRNAGDRETFYGQGKLPHSIRFGDTWVEFQRVQPIGQLLQIGASISEAIEAYKNTGQLSSEEAEKEALNSISDIGSMVFTQSPFTGMADLFALLQGGAYNEGYIKAGNRYIGQMMGTFIPNVLRRLTVAGDPIIYEKRDIPSQLKSRVPGLQKDLTPRRDVFGEIARQDGTFLSRFASPIRTSEAIEGSLYDEFDNIDYTPTVPDREAFNEELSVKEYETLQKYYGPRFRDELWAIINDPAYKSLNDEQKRDVISSTSRKVLDLARTELFPVYAEKNQLRKQWEQDGYTPLVIEDALQAKFPYDKTTLEAYAEAILERSKERGDARETVENLLKR